MIDNQPGTSAGPEGVQGLDPQELGGPGGLNLYAGIHPNLTREGHLTAG